MIAPTIILTALALAQAEPAAPASQPAATAQPETTAEAEPAPVRTCRYVRQMGSTMQRRVCSDDAPRRRGVSSMHSTWEAQSMLDRMQGSREPDRIG